MISPLAAPSDEERAWLEGRREIVLDALQPGERSALEDKLHGFAFGFSQLRSLDRDTFAATLANFVDAVDHLPFEAVSRACRAWNKAQFKWANTAFPPQAPELARAATEKFCEMRMEERELRILLGAKAGYAEAVKPRAAPPVVLASSTKEMLDAVIKSAAPLRPDADDGTPRRERYPAGFLDELKAREERRLRTQSDLREAKAKAQSQTDEVRA